MLWKGIVYYLVSISCVFVSCFIWLSGYESDVLVKRISGSHMNDELRNNMEQHGSGFFCKQLPHHLVKRLWKPRKLFDSVHSLGYV